jgi:hypothetical protein
MSATGEVELPQVCAIINVTASDLQTFANKQIIIIAKFNSFTMSLLRKLLA